MAVDGDSEDDYDWVTDTEEENPEYECDACGRLVDETKDRFHCNSCGDYDLVRMTEKGTYSCCAINARRTIQITPRTTVILHMYECNSGCFGLRSSRQAARRESRGRVGLHQGQPTFHCHATSSEFTAEEMKTTSSRPGQFCRVAFLSTNGCSVPLRQNNSQLRGTATKASHALTTIHPICPFVQCQACFLSHKAPAGQQHGEQAGSGHLASHDVSRIMAKPAVPGRTR